MAWLGFVCSSEWSPFAPNDGIGDSEGVSTQHIDVVMAERRQSRFVLGLHVIAFHPELIEDGIHIDGVP